MYVSKKLEESILVHIAQSANVLIWVIQLHPRKPKIHDVGNVLDVTLVHVASVLHVRRDFRNYAELSIVKTQSNQRITHPRNLK